MIDTPPRFSWGIIDSAGELRWPLPRSTVVCVNPSQDLVDRQDWKIHPVSFPTMFGKQLSQGGIARKPTPSVV
jgi:hypothetical protein